VAWIPAGRCGLKPPQALRQNVGAPSYAATMGKVWDSDLPSYEAIAEYWYCKPLPGSDHIPLIDLGEPECFACGWCRLEQVRSERAQKDIWKGLQRAHVVARSLDGSATVENLALLCKPCHEASPDTADPTVFWRWVADHPKNGSMAYLFQIRDFDDLRVTDYRGPWANYLCGLGSLTDDELAVLMSIYEADPPGMRQRLRAAERRLGGITRHWGIGLSSGTVAALSREIVRHERTAKLDL
jgi:HNH endonuclease